MKTRWVYCADGKQLPEPNRAKVCVFRNSHRVWLKTCVLIPDIFEDGKSKWVVKGGTTDEEVFPFAYLEIEEDFPVVFFMNLERKKVLELLPPN